MEMHIIIKDQLPDTSIGLGININVFPICFCLSDCDHILAVADGVVHAVWRIEIGARCQMYMV